MPVCFFIYLLKRDYRWGPNENGLTAIFQGLVVITLWRSVDLFTGGGDLRLTAAVQSFETAIGPALLI